MRKLKLLAALSVAAVIFIAGCKKDEYQEKIGVCPLVVSTVPADKAIDVPLEQIITATFNEEMDPATINEESFIIQQGTTSVAGTVAYSGMTASFTPSSPLLPDVLYSGTIKTLAKDLLGQALQQDHLWSFTTIAEVALSSSPTEGGTTSGAGTFINDATIIIVATANEGYSFINWTLNETPVSTNPDYQFTMDGNKALVANFTLQLVVGLSSNPAEGGTTTGDGAYDSGESVTVSANANEGYLFTNWTEGTDIVSENENYTFTITGNRELVANFTENAAVQFTVDLSSSPPEGGTTTGDGTYDLDESVTVSANANEGYSFTNWTEGTDVVSEDANYTFTITDNRELVANFTANELPAGPLAIDLGCAEPFAVLAGSTIESTGPTIINGDVGLSPGSALVGFPPGIINGTKEITTSIAADAKVCLTSAYNDGQGRSLNAISLPGQLGGLTLAPGLYSNSSTSGISGTGPNGILTLDAQGNANAVWIFQIGSTLKTDPATSIVLAGEAQAKNIFWIVGSSATLGTTSVFYGNILADQSITLNTGAVLNGRALTRIAAVTLDASTITKP